MRQCGRNNWPVLVVPGSDAANKMFTMKTGKDPFEMQEEDGEPVRSESGLAKAKASEINPDLKTAFEKCTRIQVCRNNSEEVAASAHLLLTVDI